MDLLRNFDKNFWVNGDPSVKAEFNEYRIAKNTKEEPSGQYSYAVFDNYGNLQKVFLNNANNACDPLNGVNNIMLRINDENVILGICVEDDCVLNKCIVGDNTQKNKVKTTERSSAKMIAT